MGIKEFIGIKNKDVISIVGAGGKTTLMYALGKELSDKKVLLSTTTKVFPPKFDDVNFYALGQAAYLDISNNMKNGSFLYSNSLTKEGKLDSVLESDIEKFKEDFNYIVLECDGSKRKPLKGWTDREPVIPKETTITIGVLDITTLNKLIDEDLVHRLSEFLKISNSKEHEVLKDNHIVNMIFNENGLFKSSRGRRILFINKIEHKRDIEALSELLDKITTKNRIEKLIERIVYGSLKDKKLNCLIYKE